MSTKKQIEITFDGLAVRSLQEHDIERLRVLRNAKREFFIDKRVITPEMQANWYKKYTDSKNDYMFAIVSRDTVGFFALYNYLPKSNSYEFGRFVVDDSVSGEGIGSKALEIAMALCFSYLDASSARLEVLKENERAIHVYEKIGFEKDRAQESCESIHMHLSASQFEERFKNVYSSIKAQIQN